MKFIYISYFLFTIFAYLLGLKELYLIWVFFSLLIITLEYSIKRSLSWQGRIFSLLLLLPVGIINIINEVDIIFQVVIDILSLFTIAFLSQNRKFDGFQIIKYCSYLLNFILVLLSINVGFADFPYSLPFEKIFIGSSSNGVTTVAVVLNFTYQILLIKIKNKSDIKANILTLLITIIGFGRGAILAATLQLLGGLIYNYKSYRGYYYSLIIILLTIIIYINYESINEFIISKTKLGSGLEDIERQKILNDYSKMNIFEFFFGRTYSMTSIDQNNFGNPHNSFIRIHHCYGIFGIIYFLFWTIKSMIVSTKTILNLLILLFFGVGFFLRIFTEIIFFGTIMDIFFFTLIFQQNDKHVTSM